MPSRQDIVDEARTWIGVRWRHQGRKRSGVDCCGLVIKVANDLELSLYDTNAYGRRAHSDVFVHHFHDAGLIEVKFSDVKPGDIIITEDRNFPCHCGFFSLKRGQPHFIHAYALKKKVIEQEIEQWIPKIVTVFRFPGVE